MRFARWVAVLTMSVTAFWVTDTLVRAQGSSRLDFKVIGNEGSAQMSFDRWLLVFEGIPCRSNELPGQLFLYTDKTPSGHLSTSWGCVKRFTQDMNSQGNDIALDGFRFKMLGPAEKLVFADQTYARAARTQTIIIDRDGKTRLSEN